MLIERIGAVSGYNSHKEIDFGAKLALPALLADFSNKKSLNGQNGENGLFSRFDRHFSPFDS